MKTSMSIPGSSQPTGQPATAPAILLVIAFLLPFTQLIQIQLVGTLYLHDVVVPLVLLSLLGRKDATKRLAEGTLIYLLLALWLGGQVVTDIYRETPFEDYSRGWSKIFLFGVNFAAIWLLASNRLTVLMSYTLGIAIVLCIRVYVVPIELWEVDPWKFGPALGLLLLGAIVGQLKAMQLVLGRYAAPLMLFLVSVVNLILNSRSAFAIGLLAALYSSFTIWTSRRPAVARAITPPVFMGMALGGVLLVQAMQFVYGEAARTGMLGQIALAKYELQASGDLSILMGGRVESLVSTEAIADSPLLGHGSWAKDRYYVRRLYDKMAEYNMVTTGTAEGNSDLIPSHSHLFGAWVEAGILGGLFWIAMILLTIRALYSILKIQAAPHAVVVVTAMWMLWDIMFSPFGADGRFLRGLQISILLVVVQSVKREKIRQGLRTPPVPQRSVGARG